MLRRQLAVHSPITVGALGAGALAALRRDGNELRDRVEGLIGARYGASAVVLTDSGTSALRLAMAGAVADRPGEVLIPGYSCYDMATAAEGAGVRVGLYDLDPYTLGPDGTLDSLISAKTSAVVVAHLFGHLVDMPAQSERVGDSLLIEDAAQGVGGTLHGRPLGSFGSLSVLSFGRGKGMTGGGGGALLAMDDRGRSIVEWARRRLTEERRARGVFGLGALAVQYLLGRPSLYWIPASMPFLHLGDTTYHPPRPPRPASASSLGVLERIVPEADRAAAVRARHARRLGRALARSPTASGLRPFAGGEPGYLRLPAFVTDAAKIGTGRESWRRLGIARGYPNTLSNLASLRPYVVGPAPHLPGSEALARRLVTLPTHGLLSERDIAAVEAWLLDE